MRLQIKGRCIWSGSKPTGRIGRIDLSKPFDALLLVLLNENLEATEIYEATRDSVSAALMAPGSRSRNVRGALGISKFKGDRSPCLAAVSDVSDSSGWTVAGGPVTIPPSVSLSTPIRPA